jgi:hypothetical protein
MTKPLLHSTWLILSFLALFSPSLSAQTGTTTCVNDTIKPFFERCPTNIVLTTNDTCAVAQWANPLAYDNCGTPSVIGTHQSGMCFRIGTTTVGYVATDSSGNRTYCSFVVTVNRTTTDVCATDTIKPRFINCPTILTFTTADTCARVQWTPPTATDNCTLQVVIPSHQPGTCFRIGSTSVSYLAIDAKGNRAECTFGILVTRTNVDTTCARDTIKPRIANCPTNITLTTTDTCARAQWAAPTATDNCGIPSVIGSHQSGFCFRTGITTVGYVATDAKGNKSYCSFAITVNRLTSTNPCTNDTIKPRFLSCPENIVLNTLDTCARAQWATPSAIDNCSNVTLTGSHQSGNCFRNGTATTVTYTATDTSRNRSVCTFTVTVRNPCANDTIKPTIYRCPSNIVLSSTDSCVRAQWPTPYATDNCSTPSVIGSHQSGFCFRTGVTTVDYVATDANQNRSVCSFTVTVTNPCANDTTKPRFERCPSNIVMSSLDTCSRAQWAAPLAFDNCSTPSVIGSLQSGFCFKTGVTTVTYTATDAKNNKSYCTFTVTVLNPCVNDTIKPTIYNCPTNITKETPNTNAVITWRTPAAIDNCGAATLTVSQQSGTAFPVGTTTVVYTATDSKGNQSLCRFTVTIVRVITPCSNDTIAPVFANCPTDVSVSTASMSAIAQWTPPTATDNCSTPSVSSNFRPGASFPIGTTAISYSAADPSHNVKFCNFNVVVTKRPLVIDSTKCYVLVARSSKKAMTIANNSTVGGTDAVQWTYLNGLNQKWKISPADSNSVNLTAKHSNMNLDTRWGTTANGSRLMQWGKSTALTQKWQLVALTDGYFKVINKASGRALSVNGGSTSQADGTLLVQLDYAAQNSQQWSIEEVACTSTSPNANFTTNDVLEVEAKPEFNRARIEFGDNTGYKNDYYEVEKLNNKSGQFERLAIVNNSNFDNQTTYQSVYDNTPTEGDNFYRVKVVYIDSLSKMSTVKKLSFNGLETIKVFPNPANDYVEVDLSKFNNETISVYLYNAFGQKVAFQSIQKGKSDIIRFDVADQQSGSYLVRVTAQGKRDVMKKVQIAK